MNEVPPPKDPAITHETVETSFVEETAEVKVMTEAIKSRERAYLFWYEKAQNAEDSNDYAVGLPQIVCALSDGTQVNYDRLSINSQHKPVRVEIRNHIKGDNGMDPYHLGDI